MSLIGGGCPMTYVGGSCVSAAFSPNIQLSKNYLSSSPVTTASTSSCYGSVSTPLTFSCHGNGSTPARRFIGESVPSNGTPCGLVKSSCSSNNGIEDSGLLPVPCVQLFPPEKIRMQWDRSIAFHHPIGLINAGNSCFLNSVLQCLTFTAPLANYFMQNGHSRDRMCPEFCIMCRLQRHVQLCFTGKFNYFRPNAILDNLPAIARHMERFRQEDAHDFLRCLTDTMQRRLLFGHNKLDRYSRETTLLNHIFGGYLRSQVVCSNCKAVSNTYEPFLDLSLEVKDVSTLTAALQLYCSNEVLDNDNAYSCGRCKQKVRAHKRFTIDRPSRVLTIQLKRYAAGGVNIKLSRHTQFPVTIDIGPYLSAETNDTHLCYDLYGVLVHYGMTTTSGHYYCCVLAPNNRWYKLNDATVTQISREEVLKQEAYMLFYIRSSANRPVTNANGGSQSINGNVHATYNVGPSTISGPKPMTPGPRVVTPGSATVGPRLSAAPRVPAHTNGVRLPTPVHLRTTLTATGAATGAATASVSAGISQSNGLNAVTGSKPSITVIKHYPATTVTTATTSKLVTTTTAAASSVTSTFTPAAAAAVSPLTPVVSRQKVSFCVQRRTNLSSCKLASTTVSSTTTRLPAPLVPYDDEEESDTEKDPGVVEKMESEVLSETSTKLVDGMASVDTSDLTVDTTKTYLDEPPHSVGEGVAGLVDGKVTTLPLPHDISTPLSETLPFVARKPSDTEHLEDTLPVAQIELGGDGVSDEGLVLSRKRIHEEETGDGGQVIEDRLKRCKRDEEEVRDGSQVVEDRLKRRKRDEEEVDDGSQVVEVVVEDRLKRHKRSHHKHHHHHRRHRHRSPSSQHPNESSRSKHNGKLENDASSEEEVDYIWVEKTKDDGASRSVSDCTLPCHQRQSMQAAVSKSWHSPSQRHHRDHSHHRDRSHQRTNDIDDCEHEHKRRSLNCDVWPPRYDRYSAGDDIRRVTSHSHSNHHR